MGSTKQRLIQKEQDRAEAQDENRFIIKIQISITTTASMRQALVYNEDRTVMEQFDAPKDLIRRVGNRMLHGPKRFFWAHIDERKILIIDENAPDQSW